MQPSVYLLPGGVSHIAHVMFMAAPLPPSSNRVIMMFVFVFMLVVLRAGPQAQSPHKTLQVYRAQR